VHECIDISHHVSRQRAQALQLTVKCV